MNETMFLEQEEDVQQAMSLEEFLCANSVEGLTERVVLCERLKHFEFEIKLMTTKEHHSYISQCRRLVKKQMNFDEDKYNKLVILNHCLSPNFNDVGFIAKAGCRNPEQLLSHVLKAGEIIELANRICEISGFDQDFELLKDEAKN